MYNYVKPFKLFVGHNYKLSFGTDTKIVYKLIKVTKKGYKFLNLRTNSCGNQELMYSSITNTKTSEVRIWLPSNLVIIEIPLAEMEIGICGECNQMTNHRNGMCLKCNSKQEQTPDLLEEEKLMENMEVYRTKPHELREYEHQDLMNDLNDMMIRIKRHLFGIEGDTVKPENQELDDLTNRLMAVLKEDSRPLIKH